MALPAIFRRLFRDNGYSSLLKPEIIPFTADASSNAADVAASTSWVRNATNGYINGLSISGKTITYTKGNGTTGTITTQDTTYSAATQSASGLMSAADKKKLDGINAGAGKYAILAKWTHPAEGSKTITGCTVAKPLFIIRKTTDNAPGVEGEWCAIRIDSGAEHATTFGDAYYLATKGGNTPGSSNALVVIPNATSVVIYIWAAMDDDEIYVYQ